MHVISRDRQLADTNTHTRGTSVIGEFVNIL